MRALLLLAALLGTSAHAKQDIEWLDLVPDTVREKTIFYANKVMNAHRMGGNHLEQYAQVQDMRSNGEFNELVHELHGTHVRLAGFIVPLQIDGDQITEIMIAPYPGACLQAPPPPENQLIYVRLKESIPYDALYEPIWVDGDLLVERVENELAPAGYGMKNASWEFYSKKD